MLTLADAITRTGTDVLDHLDRQASIPTVTRAAMQGDVSILRVTTKAATTPLGKHLPVVRGENGGNTHALHADGECYYDATECHHCRRSGAHRINGARKRTSVRKSVEKVRAGTRRAA